MQPAVPARDQPADQYLGSRCQSRVIISLMSLMSDENGRLAARRAKVKVEAKQAAKKQAAKLFTAVQQPAR